MDERRYSSFWSKWVEYKAAFTWEAEMATALGALRWQQVPGEMM